MSIWATDLGYDATWPDWFVHYRMATDAEVNAMIAALQRGDLSEDDFTAWALEDAERHVRWLESLPPARRAWIEAHEEPDRIFSRPSPAAEDHGAWPAGGGRGVH